MIGKKEQKNSMYTNFIKHMKKPNIIVIRGQKNIKNVGDTENHSSILIPMLAWLSTEASLEVFFGGF